MKINKMNQYYIRTKKIIDEEINGDNETTFFIEGEISKNGADWEECMFIWDDTLFDVK